MKRRALRQWMMIFGAAALLYGAGSMFQPTVVVGKSMEPTLDPGKVIYVDRTAYFTRPPSRGEVVVFKRGHETYVKRVYRGPGESYHYLSSYGQFLGLVAAEDAEQMRQRWARSRSTVTVRKAIVPEDSVYVVGDNAPNSEDSRAFGPIEIGTILGRAHLEVDLDRTRAVEFHPDPLHRRAAPKRMAGVIP